MTAPTRQAIDSGDLWRWVDRLTRDRRQRLVRQIAGTKTVTVEYVPVPSLWTQLEEALASSSSGDEDRAGKNTGSRSPLDLAIEALLIDMSTSLRRGLKQHGGHPRVLAAADDRLRHDIRSDLRQLATLIVGRPDQALVDAWAARYRSWVSQAEDILTGDQENIDLRGIRGHACPTCGQAWVERCEPSTDPRATDGVERYRDPALVIAFRDGQVQHITCRACDTGWWRGDDVDQLAADIRNNSAPMPNNERPVVNYGGEGDDVNHGGRLAGRSDDWWPWPEPRGGSAA